MGLLSATTAGTPAAKPSSTTSGQSILPVKSVAGSSCARAALHQVTNPIDPPEHVNMPKALFSQPALERRPALLIGGVFGGRPRPS